jgi:hypothetical protein
MGKFPESCWAVLVDDQLATVVGHVALTFRIWHEDGAWQGICSELHVPSFGDDPGEALNSVIDATIGYLNEIEQIGSRDQIFTDRGLRLRTGLPAVEQVSEEVAPGDIVSRLDLGLTAVAS